MKEFNIRVFETTGSANAVTSDDGNRLFEKIDTALSKDVAVTIDFDAINLITSAFLNAAIGQLYSKYESDTLNSKLKITNMEDEDLELLSEVIERAKEYFANKEAIDQAIQKEMD